MVSGNFLFRELKFSVLSLGFGGLSFGMASFATADAVERKINFRAGANSSSVSGSVMRGESDRFVLWASQGQKMSVHISSVEDNAVFQISAPGKSAYLLGAGDDDDAKNWKGTLPKNGKYTIIVGGTRGNATYKVEVTIAAK